MNSDSPIFLIGASGAAALAIVAVVGGLLYGCPQYKVYSQRMDGEAELAQANYSKQVQVQDAYLRYLWINKLSDSEAKGGQVIYVPTEAGLPILEAGRSIHQGASK